MNKENKRFMSPSFDEVMQLDQSLQYLASYEVTKGLITIPNSHEELIDLNEKIATRFNYFKGLIQRGECTFDFIRNSVLKKYGAFPRDKTPIDFSDTKCFEQVAEQDNEPAFDEKLFVEKCLAVLFPDFKTKKLDSSDNDKEIKIELSMLPEQTRKPINSSKKNNKKRKSQNDESK
jgi:hypothetical protein